MQIAIYGAGGFARELAWLIEQIGEIDRSIEPVCYVDDNLQKQNTVLNGLPILSLEEARARFPSARIVGGVGSPATRKLLVEKAASLGFEFATVVHPRAEISRWIELGSGTVICAGCILTTNIRLGRHVQINLDCTIGHDVIMGDYTTLAPGVHVSGWVHMGKRVYVGTGAVFLHGTQDRPLVIGDDTVVGAGAVVTRPVPPQVTVVGVPARPIGQSKA
ncbi:MAG: acetyltransferase [Bradymonadales bacterium]|nr:acetyltransferase [Bradymonadales bacterium]